MSQDRRPIPERSDFYAAPVDSYVSDDGWLIVADEAWTLQEWTREHRPVHRGPYTLLAPRVIDEIVACHHRGMTLQAVAAKFSVTERTVERYLASRGIRPARSVLVCPECGSTCMGGRGLAAHRRQTHRKIA